MVGFFHELADADDLAADGFAKVGFDARPMEAKRSSSGLAFLGLAVLFGLAACCPRLVICICIGIIDGSARGNDGGLGGGRFLLSLVEGESETCFLGGIANFGIGVLFSIAKALIRSSSSSLPLNEALLNSTSPPPAVESSQPHSSSSSVAALARGTLWVRTKYKRQKICTYI